MAMKCTFLKLKQCRFGYRILMGHSVVIGLFHFHDGFFASAAAKYRTISVFFLASRAMEGRHFFWLFSTGSYSVHFGRISFASGLFHFWENQIGVRIIIVWLVWLPARLFGTMIARRQTSVKTQIGIRFTNSNRDYVLFEVAFGIGDMVLFTSQKCISFDLINS